MTERKVTCEKSWQIDSKSWVLTQIVWFMFLCTLLYQFYQYLIKTTLLFLIENILNIIKLLKKISITS